MMDSTDSDASSDSERVELPRSPRSGTTWELDVDELSVDGHGVATLPALVGPQREPKDFRFHIRKAVPGDRVQALVERRRGERIDARLETLLEPSPERVEPKCRHFGRRERTGEGCGGCTLQSLPYDAQVAAKMRTVKSFIEAEDLETGGIEPILRQDDPWFYRNKMEFSFGDTAEREFALGLHPRGYRHEVVNLEECHLQSSFTSAFVPAVREWATRRDLAPYINSDDAGFLRTLTVREGKRTGDRMVDLMTTHDETAEMDGSVVEAEVVADQFREFVESFAETHDEPVTSIYWTEKRAVRGEPTEWIQHHLAGEPALEETLRLPEGHELSFEIDPRAFFQPNTRQAEVLYRTVLQKAGLIGRDASPRTVLDLYCGTGTIGLSMAPYADRVLGIEMQADAVANARANAEANGFENTTFFVGDVADVMEGDDFRAQADDVDLMVVDPPRAGLQPDARDQVHDVDCDALVYVSCNPEALARDLADLSGRGWRVDSIRPVDMFPHTYHIECVASLHRG